MHEGTEGERREQTDSSEQVTEKREQRKREAGVMRKRSVLFSGFAPLRDEF
jgi:hypothetical protein